jgi:serine/threonine protein kinase
MKAGKILIIEDDPLWQEFLQEPLGDDYFLTVASTKAEARAALDQARAANEPFHLATVDIGLTGDIPSLEGEDILAFVHQHHKGLKCIVVTGHESVNTTRLRNYFKDFAVFDYVGKEDFDLNRFKQIVDRAFDFHGYRLLAELGRGGMSAVYQALDYQNGHRLVALKVLHQDPRLSPEEAARHLARFAQEAETVQRLNHPHIVTVYTCAVTPDAAGEVFLVMEYLPGQTLEKILSHHEKLPISQIIKLGQQLCDGLAYAHSRQVIHRDIKPSNLMLLPEGSLKITDFGIAKVKDTTMSLTLSEEIFGTLDYMPPEQILNTKDVDHRVDIYAAGAVLYELVAGQKPYTDPLQKLQQDSLPLPPSLGQLAPVIMQALARSPADRFQSAQAMAEALQTCLLE